MLTRLWVRRDFRVVARCLSDKPSDGDGKGGDNKSEPILDPKKSTESSTEKIQSILKSMLTQPKISQDEYRQKFAMAPERRRRHREGVDIRTEKIEESLTKAAVDVAQAIGGDIKHTEAELLSKVLGKINQTSTSLSDLIVGMKVDRSKDPDQPVPREYRGQQVKKLVQRARDDNQNRQYTPRQPQNEQRSMPQATIVNLWSGEPLGIFTAESKASEGTKLDVWDNLKQREVVLATTQPPTNYFQKMILWTEQGKVWKFPIDNEQGMEEEADVHFSEHIFLDQHLEGWCPEKGPIRHFMELVCVGLSKNAFYTVQEKKEHILWYKEYFESKKDLLTEVGAWKLSGETKTEASA